MFVSIKIYTVRIAELTGCGLTERIKVLKREILKLNFVMNAILTMSSIIFPLITFRYVSNILLPDGTGKVSFAISLITYFNVFSQLNRNLRHTHLRYGAGQQRRTDAHGA